MLKYSVRRAKVRPELNGDWEGRAWSQVERLQIDHFHPASSDHRPITRAKALYDDRGLYLIFDVQDRYVRCVHTTYQSAVYKDSCVEFFVQPTGAKGYINFEMNCGGSLLASYVTNPGRIGHVRSQ